MEYMQTSFKRKIACEEIAGIIRKAILSGELSPGSAITSERKLAEMYNVTHVTARKATQKLVDENLIVKVHGKGAFVSEKISAGKNSIKCMGFILCARERSAPFYFDLIAGVEKELEKYGYHLIFLTMNDYKNESDIPRMIKENAVDGVIVTGLVPQKLLKFFRKNDVNHVLIAHSNAYNGKSDVVASDDRDGGYKAAEYLLKKGHKKMTVFRGFDENRPHDSLREAGFRDACEEYGCELDDSMVVKCDLQDFVGIKEAALTIFKQGRPDAIFATNGNLALGVFKAAEIEGLNVPEDLEFSVFSDSEQVKNTISSPIIVRMCRQQIGKASVSRLLSAVIGESIGKNLNLVPTELMTGE